MLSILLLIARLVLPLPPAAIQAKSGSISGVIRQTNGEPARGVRVMAVEASPAGAATATGTVILSSLTETNLEGRYRLQDVPPGEALVPGETL
ncbi:MAG TPA: carboxypeptidase-like regulatory domain-containing protein [Terriglobia bacterium]|nr:carboxypeptidase-like regulatory domain-containing protein [Terriglobia bacterium]